MLTIKIYVSRQKTVLVLCMQSFCSHDEKKRETKQTLGEVAQGKDPIFTIKLYNNKQDFFFFFPKLRGKANIAECIQNDTFALIQFLFHASDRLVNCFILFSSCYSSLVECNLTPHHFDTREERKKTSFFLSFLRFEMLM